MKNRPKKLPQLSFRAATCCLVAGMIALSPALVAAQDSGEPAQNEAEEQAIKEKSYKEHLAAGSRAYKKKDFDKALEELEAAYSIDPRASILFNLGLISEKKGDLEGASDYYRRFIGAEDVGLAARKRASERLAVVNEILDQQNEADSSQSMTNLMPALEAMNADLEEMGAEGEGTQGEQQEQAAAQTEESTPEAKPAPKPLDETGQQTATKETPADTPVADASGSSDFSDVDYGWEPYAAFTVGTGALVGGVVALALFNDSVESARKHPEGTTLHKQYERDASDYLTLTGGLFTAGGVLVGLGTYYVVARQAEYADSVESGDASSTSVSLGPDFVGFEYSLDF